METVSAILQLLSPYIRRTPSGATFTIVCTVSEGTACRFGGASFLDQSLAFLTQQIVSGIGWKHIEHAARRQVVIRCVVTGEIATAEIDLGDGLIALPVKPEGES